MLSASHPLSSFHRTSLDSRSWTSIVLALSVLASIGCEGDVVPTQVRALRGDGSNPLSGASALSIRVQQEENAVEEFRTTGGDDAFDIPLRDPNIRVQLAIEIERDDGDLIGATPSFLLGEAGGLVRVPVGRAMTCEAVDGLELVSGAGSAGAIAGSFAMLSGGAAAPNTVRFLDLLRVAPGTLDEPLDLAAPNARAAHRGNGEVLLLRETGGATLVDLSSLESRYREVRLHPGAGGLTAIASDGDRVALLGGELGGEPSSSGTFLEGGSIRDLELLSPRSGAVAAFVGDEILVVGGVASGEPVAELVPLDGRQSRAIELSINPSDSAAILSQGTTALLIDGSSSGWIDCSGDCTFDELSEPFMDDAMVSTDPQGEWLVSSGSVFHIDIPARSITRVGSSGVGPDLPVIIAIPGAHAYVLGGADPMSVQVCFPESIRVP